MAPDTAAIRTWVARSHPGSPDDSGDSDGAEGPQGLTELSWEAVLPVARRHILSSKLSVRLPFLTERVLPLARGGETSLSQSSEILKVLMLTPPRYSDPRSTEAVLDIVAALVANALKDVNSGNGVMLLDNLVQWLAGEADRLCNTSHGTSVSASTTRLALLAWNTRLLAMIFRFQAPETVSASTNWLPLLNATGNLLDSLQDPVSTRRPQIRKSALVSSRKVFRKNHGFIPAAFDSLTQPSSSIKNAPLLGVLVDVSLRLRVGKEREKGSPDGIGFGYVRAAKPKILQWWLTSVLSARHLPPARSTLAFTDFLEYLTTADDLLTNIIPTASKMLLRSPETALPTLSTLFSIWPHEITPSVRDSFLGPINSSAKSSNSGTRTGAVTLFGSLITKSPDDLTRIAEEVAAPIKSGKSVSAEHRTALLNMLASIPPCFKVSLSVVGLCASLTTKETNETVLQAISDALHPHLSFTFSNNINIDGPASQALVKAVQDPRPATRCAFSNAIGLSLWTCEAAENPASSLPPSASLFASPLSKALEVNLKNAATNPLTSAAGPLEGYVAVALAYGPLAAVTEISVLRKVNSTLSGVSTCSPKPSFLYIEKLYKKSAATPEDGAWLVRALAAIFPQVQAKLQADDQFRIIYAQTWVYLSVQCPVYKTRVLAIGALAQLGNQYASLVVSVLLQGIRAFLAGSMKQQEELSRVAQGARLRVLISAIFDTSSSPHLMSLLISAFALCHHASIDTTSSYWVGLARGIQADPEILLSERIEEVFAAIMLDATDPVFTEAAYRAVSSVCLIAPGVAVPRLLAEAMRSLDPKQVEFIGAEEYGIWITPEGTPYVDVLATQKDNKGTTKDPKRRAIEEWESELRESIAKKKAGDTKSLTKQQQALVDTQLAREAAMRTKLRGIIATILHGFRLSGALVGSGTHAIEQASAALVERHLELLSTEAAVIFAAEGFAAFESLLGLCNDRLRSLGIPLVLAVLRGTNTRVVPSGMSCEPLADLVTRAMYKVRALAEQQAIDAASFAYIMPLVSRVISSRGAGLKATQVEEAMEQMAISADILNFSGAEASRITSLRPQLIANCLVVIGSFPQLTKQATSAIVSVGLAIAEDTRTADVLALLAGMLSPEAPARYAALLATQPLDLTELGWSKELWVARFDDDERNAGLAEDVWAENGLEIPDKCLDPLLELLEHEAAAVRGAAGKALAAAAAEHDGLASAAVEAISSRYETLARELLPEYDRFGMIIQESLDRPDPWQARSAQASALRELAPVLKQTDIMPYFGLLIEKQSLGDRHEEVRTRMLAAGNAVVDLHGAQHLEALISAFEAVLARNSSGSDATDFVAEAAVILFGRLARHLDAEDARLTKVIDRLIEALKTPSEVVQSAVSECLPPLVRLRKENSPALVEKLLHDTLSAPSYAQRRGSAYGLAGVVKGCGLSSLKKYSIIARLRDVLDDKKNPQARQGAIFALEIFTSSLRRLFEPYLIQMTSSLLTAFGDGTTEVRAATQDAAASIMRGLSGHAVKMILPTLLEGLDDKQWRAKKGAIELMGAMAYLAPRQLSSALPTIIPRLTDVLTDTHTQVRAAANASLKKFGEVITNPEISSMQDTLLGALVDPARKTPKALDSLLGTAFVHVLDTSALALVVPIIERGLRERSAETKRKAAQIVGNLATLTDAKDFIPYLPQLLPKVRHVLVDPVPEARATAAKALGGLVERLGEDSFPDLVPSLFDTLRANASGVDQQGAAQGLSEIMSGLGTEKLDELLPDIIANTGNKRAYVREGFISLLIFLPATYGDRFAPYLGRIIQPVLNGLADESDYVRDASMRAGRMIVANHSGKAIDLLLPELERGLFDSSWRIRQSSIQLLGDLLFRVSGITGKAVAEEEDEEQYEAPSVDASSKALTEALGRERRDRVLAAVYIVRQDSSGIVRSSSVHVWKALVHNTPKTVRDIMPTLMQSLVRILASQGDEQRETAARTLGELVRKLGEGILANIVSILQKAATSQEPRTRQGACLAIIDVLESASKTQLEDHESTIITVVRTGLVDQDTSVRKAAAQAFDCLQQQVGPRAVEETLPTLLNALREPGAASGAALAALTELMRVRAASILPKLVPVLLKQPMTAFNARSLSSLASVAGPSIDRYLTHAIDALRTAWTGEQNEENREAFNGALSGVFAAIATLEGANSVMMHLLGLAKSESPTRRADACDTFTLFCVSATFDIGEYYILWVRQLVSLFEDPSPPAVDAAWNALDAMVKRIPKDEMEALVVPLRRSIEGAGMPGRDLPGFARAGGLKPVMPILLQGILSGTAEQREQAALAFGDIVERTSPVHIKPFVTQITGPLIRIIGDRFPPPVKSAILHSLGVLLLRIPQFIKPFYPQLQRTFVKSLSDPTSTVRSRAVAALGILMEHQPRIDPLITELIAGARGSEPDACKAMIWALGATIGSGGKNVGPQAMSSVLEFLQEAMEGSREESYLSAVAKLVAGIARSRAEDVRSLLEEKVLAEPPTPIQSLCLRELVEQAPDAIYELGILSQLIARVVANSQSGQPPSIGRPARDAKEALKASEVFAYDEAVSAL